jgi:hypothetical protein
VVFAHRDELILGIGVERGVRPFSLRLQEEGKSVCADMDSIGDRILNSWRYIVS